MFAVKSEYCIKPTNDITISFYVAGNDIYFARREISDAVYGSLFGVLSFVEFENCDGDFARFTEVRDFYLEKPSRFMNCDFWHEVFSKNYSKVIAEVRDAQLFVKEHFCLDLPQDWKSLNVDAIIDPLPIRTSDWILKCHNSLLILATNNEQKQIAREVFDKAWKILKSREKAKDKQLTLREVLDKTGLPVDAFIQGMLNVHKANFDNEQAQRQSEFDKRHEQFKADLYQLINDSRV